MGDVEKEGAHGVAASSAMRNNTAHAKRGSITACVASLVEAIHTAIDQTALLVAACANSHLNVARFVFIRSVHREGQVQPNLQ
jgi:hypothetical protein